MLFGQFSEFLSKNKYNIVVVLIFVISILSFIFSPLTADLRVMLASANQVQYYDGNWLSGVYNTWEIKGVFDRIFIYGLYRVANIFVPYASGLNYEFICNLIYSIFTVGVTALSVKIATNKFLLKPILLICTVFFASLIHAHIQPEMISVNFLVLAFAIFMNSKKSNKYSTIKQLSVGLLLGSIFFFKSIDVFMAIPYGVGILLWAKKEDIAICVKDILFVVSGSLLILLAGFLLIIILNPNEILNMQNASIYQQTLLSGGVFSLDIFRKKFLRKFIYSTMSIPIVMLGIIYTLKNVVECVVDKQIYNVILRLFLWFIPMSIIIISNKYFGYHYFLFAFPAIVECYLSYGNMISDLKTKIFKYETILYVTLVLLFYLLIKIFNVSTNSYKDICNVVCVYILITIIINCCKYEKIKSIFNIKIPLIFLSVIYLSYISIFSDNLYIYGDLISKIYSHNQRVIAEVNILGNEVLYLDSGTSTYFVGKKSYLHEHYPLCLQRIRKNSKYAKEANYKNALNNTLTYSGKYIFLYDIWFDTNKHEGIKNKIDRDYYKIGNIYGLSVGDKIFKRFSEKDLFCIDVYVRK